MTREKLLKNHGAEKKHQEAKKNGRKIVTEKNLPKKALKLKKWRRNNHEA